MRPEPSPIPLSVVVPTHQTRELALRCLESLRAAGAAQPQEIVVVDDGSTDGTAEAVRSGFPTATLLRNEDAAGFTAAANRGAAAAHGELVLLLNSDTEVLPGSLDTLVAAFERHPELGIAGGRLLYPDRSPQWSHGSEPGFVWCFLLASGLGSQLGRRRWVQRLRKAIRRTPADDRAYRPVGWVTGAALAFRREVWEAVGPLHEGFRFYGQDLDFCRRAKDAGWEVGLVDDCKIVHHHGATIAEVAPAGHVSHQNPELLWPDLVLWAARRGGERRARSIARSLRWGAILRLTARRLAAAPRPWKRDAQWRRENEALAGGLAALARATGRTG